VTADQPAKRRSTRKPGASRGGTSRAASREPAASPPIARLPNSIAAAGVGIAALTIYLRWLPPGLTGKDAGDFATAVAVLGVPHPTGYPLYCLLGKLFAWAVPWGDLAHRLNLFSAVTAAAAACVLHLALTRLPLPVTLDPGANARLILAAAVALLVAFAPTIASQAIIPEAYPLLLLSAATLLWLCAGWGAATTPGSRQLRALAFLAGLGLTTHLTFALLLPAAAAYLLGIHPRAALDGVRGRSAGVLGLLFAAGLVPYLYLPARAFASPPLDWADARSVGALWRHVTGGAYQGNWQGPGVAALAQQLAHLREDLPLLLTVLPLLGVVALLLTGRHGRTLLLLLGGTVLTVAYFAQGYRVLDARYMLTGGFPAFAGLLFTGAAAVVAFAPRRARAAIALLLLAAPAYSLLTWGAKLDRSADDRTYRRIQEFMGALPDDSLVVTSGDFPIIPAWYLQQVEGVKPGVAFLHDSLPFRFPAFLRTLHRQRPDLVALPPPGTPPEQALPSLLRAIDANLARVPVFTTASTQGLSGMYQLDPVPIMEGSHLWRIRGRAQAVSATPIGQETPVPPSPQ